MQNLAKLRDEKGMTTAEYAVGTVATVSIVGVLLPIIHSPEFQKHLMNIVGMLIDLIVTVMGGG